MAFFLHFGKRMSIIITETGTGEGNAMDEKKSAAGLRPLEDGSLSEISGGVGSPRPTYVSSFFCEKCGRTIRLNGVYTLENAHRLHDAKMHPGRK